MLKQVIEKWDKNKLKLKEYFATHPETDYDEYEKIVRLIADIILECKEAEIVEVETGGWQGDVAFVLHSETEISDCSHILFTYTDYGSCSGCDTLMGILAYNYDSDFPTKEQVIGLMTLSMHLVQRMTDTDYSVGVDDYEDDED